MRGLTRLDLLHERATSAADDLAMDDAVGLEPVDDLALEPLLLLDRPGELGLQRSHTTAEHPDLCLSADHGVTCAPHISLEFDVRLLVRPDQIAQSGNLSAELFEFDFRRGWRST